jgi:hypothetical protein
MSVASVNCLWPAISLHVSDLHSSYGSLRAFSVAALTTVSVSLAPLSQADVRRLAFDQRRDWLLRLPNSRAPSILGGRKSLSDRHGANDLHVDVVLRRPTHAARASQTLQQLLLQGATRLNEETGVDGLV